MQKFNQWHIVLHLMIRFLNILKEHTNRKLIMIKLLLRNKEERIKNSSVNLINLALRNEIIKKLGKLSMFKCKLIYHNKNLS